MATVSEEGEGNRDERACGEVNDCVAREKNAPRRTYRRSVVLKDAHGDDTAAAQRSLRTDARGVIQAE